MYGYKKEMFVQSKRKVREIVTTTPVYLMNILKRLFIIFPFPSNYNAPNPITCKTTDLFFS